MTKKTTKDAVKTTATKKTVKQSTNNNSTDTATAKKEIAINDYCKKQFDALVKLYKSNNSLTITSVAQYRNAKENDCMYNNDYSRINIKTTANNKTVCYLRINSLKSIFVVVNNAVMYNATVENAKTLATKVSVKYDKKHNNRLVDCAYYVNSVDNAFKIIDICVNALEKIDA